MHKIECGEKVHVILKFEWWVKAGRFYPVNNICLLGRQRRGGVVLNNLEAFLAVSIGAGVLSIRNLALVFFKIFTCKCILLIRDLTPCL